MKAHIYTFYWTVKTEVQELIEVSKSTDIQAAFNKSRVMSVQHEMLQELIRNMRYYVANTPKPKTANFLDFL